MEDFVENLKDTVLESKFDIECPTCGKDFAVSLSECYDDIACPFCGEIINLES